jgi:hypothetical protein
LQIEGRFGEIRVVPFLLGYMKVTKTSLIKKCDVLFSLIVRSKGYCEVCGRSDLQLNAHHIVGRSIMILRYDFRNACCLDASCHKFNKNSAHENSPWFMDWLKENRPDDLEYVKSKSNLIAHYTIEDYQEILIRLKAQLKEVIN